MSEEPVYSNRFHLSYCRFLERKFGKEVLEEVLKEVGMDRLAFSDPNGFQPAEALIKLRAAATRITGHTDIAYLAGRSMPENLGTVTGFVAGITSPDLVMKKLGKVESSLALKTITEVKPVGRRQYRVETHFRDGFKEAPEACRNRIGSYESVPRFFGLPYARVEHPECAFRGQARCIYFVTMPVYGFIHLRKLAIGLLTLSVLALILFVCAGGPAWERTGFISLSLSFLTYAVFKHLQVRKSLEWNDYINQGLSEQNRNLEKTNARIRSLHQLTVSLGKHVRVEAICKQVVDALVQEFHYGSSQIWLLDESGKKLSCRSARGYTPELSAFILNTVFEIGKDWDNPYGLLVQTLVDRKTLLVNDVEEAIAKLTPRTKEFLGTLNLSSFIMTPLFDHDTPVGILTAEHHGGTKLDDNDRLLFQALSNGVATSLVKADLFESMERKIDQRTRELEEANRQLLAAKEMAIQSEKLSSLGQMAAGVAHEINNPLNFLVNIIPDVKRDMEGLEAIRILALTTGPGAEFAEKAREIEAAYDLESHLAEKDFVFEKIRKALDKSTRIANSLKVFSRSSAKEKVGRESWADMVREVIELIPPKVKGDTRIQADIPASLGWQVNKNEMEQAILVLINNAIDAVAQKGSLQVTGRETSEEQALEFKDDGPGIPDAILKKIFDPFFTTKPPGKGTGLGLTIAAEIVKKYGGSLSVQSEPGKGAVFLMRFRK